MSERKVLNKYYPPDFDPSKIPRRKLGKDRQQVVRLMAPFSMQCKACSEFIYKGKKFNARKETAEGETYFGIKIFRFYIKCPRCSNEITFKTDPKHTDYVAEHGAQRNFEPWREAEAHDGEEDDLARLEAAEAEETEEDVMRALENRQADSKREMDILDKLQEIRTRNARLERTDADTVLKTVSSRVDNGLAGAAELDAAERQRQEAQEDEAEVARYFAQAKDVRAVPQIELGPALETEDNIDSSGDDVAAVPQQGPSTLRPSTTPSTTPSLPPRANSPSSGEREPSPEAQTLSASNTKFIKRKADGQEPETRSLLSEEALKIASIDFSAPPPKKKKAVSALGAGLKVKGRAK